MPRPEPRSSPLRPAPSRALRGFPRAGEERWTENDPPLRPLLRGMASGFTDFLARMKTAHKVKFKRDVNRRN